MSDRQHILDSIAAIARGLGRAPSQSEFFALARISEHYVTKFFPRWNDAVRAAGLPPHTLNFRLDGSELLRDWGATVRRNRAIPSRRAYRLQAKYDIRTIERRFGVPWSSLPQVFRKFAQDQPEWADVLALLPGPKSPALAPCDPVSSANVEPRLRAASCLSSAPPSSPISRASSEGPSSGSKGLNVAPSAASLPDSLSRSPLATRHSPLPSLTYGNPTNFRGLRHEPVNEQGVVLLFGMLANKLRYMVQSVQTGFPDCEAMRQIAPERWQRVLIEFEFESRNFRDHGHPPTGCDLIVCWRHNWPDCPPHLEILELSTVLQSLTNPHD